jgi:hypothetical protein
MWDEPGIGRQKREERLVRNIIYRFLEERHD